MGEFKGSEGKWSYQAPLGEIKSDTDGLIADLVINGREDENGQLMAAAPELLEALQGMMEINRLDGDGQALKIRAAKDAIAKALGQ